MSTDLYRIRVLALDKPARRVTFRVFLVYYDWSGVPTDPSFFMRILWDKADTRFGGGGPLGHEVSVDQFLDEKWVDANTQRFVERVTRTSLRNDPPAKDKKPPTFVYENFTEEEILTQGDYEVVVTDEKWIAHLAVDMTWQTTSYATKAKMPRARSTVLADVKAKTAAMRKGFAAERKAAVPTTLREAIQRADLEAIRALVAEGAPLNPTFETFGDFPLEDACRLVKEDGPAMRVVELLVALGADVNHRASAFQAPPLFMTAYRGCDVLARWLVEHGASLEGTSDPDQHLVLHCAAVGGLPWLVELCLARGADPNAASRQGYRAIHYAFQTAQWKPIAEAIERAGADLLHQSNASGTALHWAALYGQANAIPWLLARGFGVNTPSLGSGKTPLMSAADCRVAEHLAETIETLRNAGADLHARTPEGLTALHIAAQNYRPEATAALLAAGADKTLKTTGPWQCGSTKFKAGVTPADVAKRLKHHEAEALLR